MFEVLLIVHILSATVWTGGHLILCFGHLPKAFANCDPTELRSFVATFEKVGIPAFVIQAITGPTLAYYRIPDLAAWFRLETADSYLIATKLILLIATAAFAVHGKRKPPRDSVSSALRALAWHIIPVTILSVLFVVIGVSFRLHLFV